MKTPHVFTLILALLLSIRAVAVQTVAELNFGPGLDQPKALAAAQVPAWVTRIEQQGGRWLSEPRCWHVPPGMPEGFGRLIIEIDRAAMDWNLAASIVFEASADADVAVQLFDAQGRAVVTDIFGNLVDVSAEAATNTLIVPWKKYPTARSIVIRRIKGDVKVYGVALYPVVTEGTAVPEELEKLARVLGDPLSPENPLFPSLKNIASQRKVALGAGKSGVQKKTVENDKPTGPVKYAAAVRPAPNAAAQPPTAGLVAHWSFDASDARDASGHGHAGKLQGGATFVDGLHGRALSLRKNPSSARAVSWDSITFPPGPALARHSSMTIAAWVNYRSIAPRWGSQIAWFGDSNYGRDPWTFQLFGDGYLRIRSDRSVTGRPEFTVFESEIYLKEGRPALNQHVDSWSPGVLAPNTWYFVAGSIEKVSARQSVLRLFVNGEKVSETRTREIVDYPIDGMWMTLGGVDLGTWQNFDGLIDEVRLYDRPLAEAEIGALYRQAWTQ